ncbi:MAG: hypothetical protein ACLUKE_00775 [Blautia wexlerae]
MKLNIILSNTKGMELLFPCLDYIINKNFYMENIIFLTVFLMKKIKKIMELINLENVSEYLSIIEKTSVISFIEEIEKQMMYILCELGSIIIVRYSVTVNYIKGDKIQWN